MKIKFFDAEKFYTEYTLTDDERDAAREFTGSFCGDEEGIEVAFAYSHGALIFRYFSEEAGYYFSPPYSLCDSADISAAFIEISEYCRLEEIQEVIIDLLDEELDLALRGAEHYDIDSSDDGTHMIRIYTECMLCDELPEVLSDDVYLGEFAMAYSDDYEKLVKNENLNLHFGYSMCCDIPNGKGEDFIFAVREEFERGTAMTFAATRLNEEGNNVFVGEGCLYGFDGRGTAYISFRVLPQYQNRGIGSKIFEGLIEVGKQIGLLKINAEVKKANSPSVSLLSRYGVPCEKNFEQLKFTFSLASFAKCEQ